MEIKKAAFIVLIAFALVYYWKRRQHRKNNVVKQQLTSNTAVPPLQTDAATESPDYRLKRKTATAVSVENDVANLKRLIKAMQDLTPRLEDTSTIGASADELGSAEIADKQGMSPSDLEAETPDLQYKILMSMAEVIRRRLLKSADGVAALEKLRDAMQ
jgi:hypothetical protein